MKSKDIEEAAHIFPFAESIGVLFPNTLEITLKTFPSTTGYGKLNAIEAIAAAV